MRKLLVLLVCLVFSACPQDGGEDEEQADRLPIPEVAANDEAIVPVPQSQIGFEWWYTKHDDRKTNVIQNRY